jgi:hypothetical protein
MKRVGKRIGVYLIGCVVIAGCKARTQKTAPQTRTQTAVERASQLERETEKAERHEQWRIQVVSEAEDLFVDNCHGTGVRTCEVRFYGDSLPSDQLKTEAFRRTPEGHFVNEAPVVINAPRMLHSDPSDVQFWLPEGANLVFVTYRGAKRADDYDQRVKSALLELAAVDVDNGQ